MRLLKSFAENDRRSDFASRVFNEVITEFDYPWHWNSMEFHIRDENKAVVRNGKAIIVIDYDDQMVRQQDYKGIKALILQQLFRLIIKEIHGPMRGPVETVAANREMVRKGYGNDLVYLYYQRLIGKQKQDLDGIIESNIGWLSFAETDKHNTDILKSMVKVSDSNADKLVSLLSKDLDEETQKEAEKLYRKLKKNADA